ncbi:MAG: PD-(D/E)XK nuclease family protein [Patescibacteria group bacterium]
MAVYSFSQVQLFLKCPLRYRFKYLDNIELEEFEQTADLFL